MYARKSNSTINHDSQTTIASSTGQLEVIRPTGGRKERRNQTSAIGGTVAVGTLLSFPWMGLAKVNSSRNFADGVAMVCCVVWLSFVMS